MKFQPTLEASSLNNINTTSGLGFTQGIQKFCSNFELFHQKIDKLKTILKTNSYPKSFVDVCIKKYLDQIFIKKEVVGTVSISIKELISTLPFTGYK